MVNLMTLVRIYSPIVLILLLCATTQKFTRLSAILGGYSESNKYDKNMKNSAEKLSDSVLLHSFLNKLLKNIEISHNIISALLPAGHLDWTRTNPGNVGLIISIISADFRQCEY